MLKPVVIALVLVLAALGGAYLYSSDGSPTSSASPNPSVTASPIALAGSPQATAPSVTPVAVMEFSMAGYTNAVKTGKLVALYYYANWCPICRESYPKFNAAILELDNDMVAAFRVSYNDSDTTDEEKQAAQTFQVGSQHTLVIVKNGTLAAKGTVSGWSQADFVTAIEEHLR